MCPCGWVFIYVCVYSFPKEFEVVCKITSNLPQFKIRKTESGSAWILQSGNLGTSRKDKHQSHYLVCLSFDKWIRYINVSEILAAAFGYIFEQLAFSLPNGHKDEFYQRFFCPFLFRATIGLFLHIPGPSLILKYKYTKICQYYSQWLKKKSKAHEWIWFLEILFFEIEFYKLYEL